MIAEAYRTVRRGLADDRSVVEAILIARHIEHDADIVDELHGEMVAAANEGRDIDPNRLMASLVALARGNRETTNYCMVVNCLMFAFSA